MACWWLWQLCWLSWNWLARWLQEQRRGFSFAWPLLVCWGVAAAELWGVFWRWTVFSSGFLSPVSRGGVGNVFSPPRFRHVTCLIPPLSSLAHPPPPPKAAITRIQASPIPPLHPPPRPANHVGAPASSPTPTRAQPSAARRRRERERTKEKTPQRALTTPAQRNPNPPPLPTSPLTP